MADYEANIAPFINVTFYVTSYFGEPRTGRDPHKGIDLATSGGHELYSMTNGTIITKEYEAGGFGNYIIIKRRRWKGFFVCSYGRPFTTFRSEIE